MLNVLLRLGKSDQEDTSCTWYGMHVDNSLNIDIGMLRDVLSVLMSLSVSKMRVNTQIAPK
jgi:hypothetical protein